jgi:hypothetical protein
MRMGWISAHVLGLQVRGGLLLRGGVTLPAALTLMGRGGLRFPVTKLMGLLTM